MKKWIDMRMVGCMALFVVAGSLTAHADTYTFRPSPTDLWDLPHSYAFLWNVRGPSLAEDEVIVGASIKFSKIYDSASGANHLYLTLLNPKVEESFPADSLVSEGTYSYQDGQNNGNHYRSGSWAGVEGTQLADYTNIPKGYSNRTDLTYEFDKSEVDLLIAYLADNDLAGLGFDPDCHFYNCGIKLIIETDEEVEPHEDPPVPEPVAGAILLGGIGAMIARRRRRS